MMYFGEKSLLYYALIFGLLTILIGFLGLSLVGLIGMIAKFLFYTFLILCALALIAHFVRKKI